MASNFQCYNGGVRSLLWERSILKWLELYPGGNMNPYALLSRRFMMVHVRPLQSCSSRPRNAQPIGKPEERPLNSGIHAARIITPLAMLLALSAHTLPAAAQDTSPEIPRHYRMAQMNVSPGTVEIAGTRPDKGQGVALTQLKADSPAFAGRALILAGMPLQDDGSPKTGPIPSPKGEMQDEFPNMEGPGSPLQSSPSKSNLGLHLQLLKQATIASFLIDLKRKFGPEGTMQSGNIHWFIDSQRFLATGDKKTSLNACSKMSQWLNFCASANARNFSVYFKGSE